jgi:regulation of enolase protein 1 (concanavalin A-like superfamily)
MGVLTLNTVKTNTMNFFNPFKSALGYLLTQSKDTCIRCCFLPVFLLLISTSISAHLPHGLTKETVGSLNRFVYEDGNQAPLLVSDDYDRANLDLIRWSFVNPLNDGWVAMTGTNTIDAYLELSVPEGQSHDPWQINRSVRAMQDAPDNDFEVDIKFASEPDPNLRYQQQGIIVEESNDNWLRFDLFSNGSGLRIFAASTVNGSSSAKLNVAVNPGEATYLRVGRTGDTWTFSYSGDGQTWTTAGSFSHAMAVSSVGPFAANHNTGGNPSPAFTAQVDYFFNTASPISPEDDGEETDVWEPFIHTTSTTAGANELTINWYTDEPSIGAIDFGLTIAYGTTETESVPTYYHSVTITGLVPGNTYHYQIRSIDDLNQEAVSKDFIYFFDPSGPTIDVWYGDTQDFGTLGNPQEFYINIFGNVSDVDGVTIYLIHLMEDLLLI